MNSYDALAPWYDRFTGDVPYDVLADWYEKMVQREGQARLTLLDLCCGTGTMTLLLARLRLYRPLYRLRKRRLARGR